MKCLKARLVLIVMFCHWGLLASAQSHPSTTAWFVAQVSHPGHRNDLRPRLARPKGSLALARPMATAPPSLPLAPTNVGFQVAPHISAGATPSTGLAVSPYLSAAGDFNHDGHPDVATIGQAADGSFWLSILLSNGDGTFQPAALTAVTFGTSDLFAVGDLNGDSNADVVLVHSSSVDVFIGDGTGTFASAVK